MVYPKAKVRFKPQPYNLDVIVRERYVLNVLVPTRNVHVQGVNPCSARGRDCIELGVIQEPDLPDCDTLPTKTTEWTNLICPLEIMTIMLLSA